MQKIRKILRAVSEIFKDGRTDYYYELRTDMGDYIGPLSGKPGVQNKVSPVLYTYSLLNSKFERHEWQKS